MNPHRLSATLVLFTPLVLAALLCFTTSASAHAPQDIRLSYDAASMTLTVKIAHSSIAPTMHYIKHVEIRKNGAIVSSSLYESQPGKTDFTYTYTLPAAQGDVIEVTGTCNFFGSGTAKLDIEKPGTKPGE